MHHRKYFYKIKIFTILFLYMNYAFIKMHTCQILSCDIVLKTKPKNLTHAGLWHRNSSQNSYSSEHIVNLLSLNSLKYSWSAINLFLINLFLDCYSMSNHV